uniref:Uncharacterized protein n=1 Tax=Hucho hucho TaxID=62062 RepID=A0A4W5JX97_9TELE
TESNKIEDKKSYDPGDRILKFVNRQEDISKIDLCLSYDLKTIVYFQGQYKLICPALKGNQKFGVVWSYQEVRRLAALTAKEIQYFEEIIATLASPKYCETKSRQWKSPWQGIDRFGNTGCSNQKLQLLRKCPTVSLSQVQGVTDCSSIRACPTCGILLEHDKTSYKNLAKHVGELTICFSFFFTDSQGNTPPHNLQTKHLRLVSPPDQIQ